MRRTSRAALACNEAPKELSARVLHHELLLGKSHVICSYCCHRMMTGSALNSLGDRGSSESLQILASVDLVQRVVARGYQ